MAIPEPGDTVRTTRNLPSPDVNIPTGTEGEVITYTSQGGWVSALWDVDGKKYERLASSGEYELVEYKAPAEKL